MIRIYQFISTLRVCILTLTVYTAILKVLPLGTNPKLSGGKDADIIAPPLWPPDLFAISAYLLYRSAAYHRIIAGAVSNGIYPQYSLVISASEVNRFRSVGLKWSRDPRCPPLVKKLWKTIVDRGASPLCDLKATAIKPARWWKAAYSLMAIADEACADVGYLPHPGSDWSDKWVFNKAHKILRGSGPTSPRSRHLRHVTHVPSITSNIVNQDVVCVQPKARTPDVGCSLRNLSHNVAFLPPRGVMRVHWLAPPAVQQVEEEAPLNLLLVPFPFTISPDWFDAHVATKGESNSHWGWFDLQQGWLTGGPRLVIELVKALLSKAEEENDIHGIVFPEFALTYEIYEQLATELRDHHPSVQFLVSGANSNCGDEKGNFAISSHFFEDVNSSDKNSNTPLQRMMATVSRPKHHRWSLDDGQIDAYNLRDAFKAYSGAKDMRWWERIPIRAREIHVNAMRGASVFTAMICEDLARSDPAHEPVRAIGPNLVFVLLMDGPQLEWRWAARYSTGLAEDPGSSVLTLTSMGLVERWNSKKLTEDQSWSIGIWKDEANRSFEIQCPINHEAVVLRLSGKRQTECTLDGRHNMQTYAWHRKGEPKPIALDRILHGDLLKRLNRS